MKKINIIKRNDEFSRIIKKYKPYKSSCYIVYVEKNNDNTYHFGFSVGKKVGKAVIRNKIKRRVKAILDKIDFKNGFNCIIIVKKEVLEKSFQEMEDDLKNIMLKISIIKENKDEEKNK